MMVKEKFKHDTNEKSPKEDLLDDVFCEQKRERKNQRMLLAFPFRKKQ
jgi:hypothetical protein